MSAVTYYNGMHCTDRSGVAFCNPTSYSGGSGFKSQPGYQLPWLNFSLGCSRQLVDSRILSQVSDSSLLISCRPIHMEAGVNRSMQWRITTLKTGIWFLTKFFLFSVASKQDMGPNLALMYCAPGQIDPILRLTTYLRLTHSEYTELYVLSPIRLQGVVLSKAQWQTLPLSSDVP
jgi:hypothetical protein